MKAFLFTGAALAALTLGSPALAQSQSPDLAELTSLLRAQADEIAALRARLDAVDGGRTAAAGRQAAAQADATSDSAFVPGNAASNPPIQLITTTQGAAANPANITTEWRGGLPTFRSPDGNYRFKVRGRIITHASSTFGSDFDDRNITTTGMRAARIGVEGSVGPHFFYQFENDFADNVSDVGTLFVGWRGAINKDVAYDVRFGNMFNDRGFEGSGGSDAPPFLERNVVGTAIIPQRGFYGIALMPRIFWKSGHASLTVSGDTVDNRQTASDSLTVMGRAHWNPVKTSRSIVHLGLWGFDEQLSSVNGSLTRNTVIGGRFNGNLRISSGALTGGTGTTGYGVEAGGYVGSVWAMAEAGERNAALDAGRSDFNTRAFSLSTGWFVTGELPPYNALLGTFAQPDVKRPVFEGGPGAVELLARYEDLEFSGVPTAGQGWAATAGANWYLDDTIRLQFNVIHWNATNRFGAFAGEDSGETVSAGIGVTY